MKNTRTNIPKPRELKPEFKDEKGNPDEEKIYQFLLNSHKETVKKLATNGGVPTKEMIKEEEEALGYNKWWSRD